MDLNWDSPYAVALALCQAHPNVYLDEVTLSDVFEWTLALPGFDDEASLCNDEILQAIFREWFEVTIDD